MAVTPNYGWPVPVATDYVKDGYAAIADLGDAIDATVFGLPSSALTLITTQTFTTSAAVNVNNCFTTTYKNYRIMVYADYTADAGIDFRFRASSADNTTTNYRYNIYTPAYDGSSNTSLAGTGATFFRVAGTSVGTEPSGFTIDCLSPKAAENSYLNVVTAGITRAGAGGGVFNASTQFDGFSLLPTSGTITGTLRVYGYKD